MNRRSFLITATAAIAPVKVSGSIKVADAGPFYPGCLVMISSVMRPEESELFRVEEIHGDMFKVRRVARGKEAPYGEV